MTSLTLLSPSSFLVCAGVREWVSEREREHSQAAFIYWKSKTSDHTHVGRKKKSQNKRERKNWWCDRISSYIKKSRKSSSWLQNERVFTKKKNEMTDRSEENEIVECKKLKIAKVREKMSESIYYDDVVNNWLIPFFYYQLCRFWSRPNSEWGY